MLENSGAACPPSADWCSLEHRRLAAARKSAEVAAHAAEDELAEIAAARARQEQSVQLVTGHYDASRTQVGGRAGTPGWAGWEARAAAPAARRGVRMRLSAASPPAAVHELVCCRTLCAAGA